jgi:hypothetical protein
MPPTAHEGRVWVVDGPFSVRSATLRGDHETVSVVLEDGVVVFEASREDVLFLTRWYWFSTMFDLRAGDRRCRVTLVHPLAAEAVAFGPARAAGTEWKRFFARAAAAP